MDFIRAGIIVLVIAFSAIPASAGFTVSGQMSVRTTPTIAASTTIVAGGLIGFYDFEEGTGSVATDSSGSGHTGTLVNDPARVDGVSGDALFLSSANSQYVTLANPSTMAGDRTAFTVNLWFRTNFGTKGKLYAEGNTGTATQHLYLSVNENADGDFEYGMRDDASASLFPTTTTALKDDNWHMLTVRQASKSSHEILTDGVSWVTDTTLIGTLTLDQATIGALCRTSCLQFWQGYVDQVRVYDKALTDGEIAALYAARQ